MPRGGAFILSDIRGPTLSIVPDGWCRRIVLKNPDFRFDHNWRGH